MTSNDLIKLAQLQGAIRHELRWRQIKKAAEESREDEIARLKKERDRGWFEDILGGAGWGSLYGAGIGGVGGGIFGALGGKAMGDAMQNAPEQLQQMGVTGEDLNAAKATASMAKDWGPTGMGILGGLGGISMGLPVGGTIGGLWRAATHNSRRQKAIDRLKELGIADTIE